MTFSYFFLQLVFMRLYTVNTETYQRIKDDFSFNLNDPYNANSGLDSVRPIAESTHSLNVTLDWNLVSINDFDDTNGYMEVSGFVTLEWTSAYPTTINAIDLITPTRLWKPPIVLLNSVNTYEVIGHDSSIKVRYNFLTKECQWKPWVVARAACSPDVKYYPFDQQSCALRLSVWGYNNTELHLDSKTGQWGFLYFDENGEWKIDETSVETSIINNFSVIDLKMKLTRRPMYYVINLISPVILLSVLSTFTFLLPVESGERVGFSVTCFLSFMVLLNLIMDFLPTSASPLSYLSYYTFVMMIFSVAMTVTSLLTIKLFHKPEDDPVPEIVAAIFSLPCCEDSKTPKREKVKPITVASASWDMESFDEEDTVSQNTLSTTDSDVHVTWRKIAKILDIVLFFGFLGGQIFYSVAYLVPIFIN